MRLRRRTGLRGGGAPAFIGPGKVRIEAGILPLVYAVNCLSACHPFWSCEGHIGPAGKVNRMPRVWFYARSVLYPRLITEYAANCT